MERNKFTEVKIEASISSINAESSQPFSKDSAKHKVITSKLAVFAAPANVAYQIVENFEFRELLSELEPRYTPPGRGVIRQEVSKILVAMKGVIKKELELARQGHLEQERNVRGFCWNCSIFLCQWKEA